MSIQFKRSVSAGVAPESAHLDQGELAINLVDKKLYTKDGSNQIINIGFSQEDADATYLRTTGGILQGRLMVKAGVLPADSALDDLVSKRYVDSKFGEDNDKVRTNVQLDGRFLKLSGGVVTGDLQVSKAISTNSHTNTVITKGYADSQYVNVIGDTLNGFLSLHANPTQNNHAANKKYVDDLISNSIATAISEALNKSHPVGSLFITTVNTNPNVILGFGTWTLHAQNRMLMGANTTAEGGQTGGASTMKLSGTHLPSHRHTVNINTNSTGSHTHPYDDVYFSENKSGTQQNVYGSGDSDHDNEFWTTRRNTHAAGNHTHNVNGHTGYYGSNTSFSLLPPYVKVYMWRRTA